MHIPHYTKGLRKTRGFTIVESLVAISILVLAVTGAFTAAQKGISSATYSKNQVLAFYLAGEGVEQIRNIRDGNGLSQRPWLTGISASQSDPCYFGNTCTVDTVNNVIAVCSGGASGCPNLQQDPVDKFYGYHSGWTGTIFKRSISLTSINANEISILVTINWNQGSIIRTFQIRENILNWQ
jgi:prepilin-type N-terminal cleavage/methylation domain-containing protein